MVELPDEERVKLLKKSMNILFLTKKLNLLTSKIKKLKTKKFIMNLYPKMKILMKLLQSY